MMIVICAVVVSQAEVNRSYTKHRKIASSFRDTQLFEIFELGINLLKKAYEMIKTVDYSDADQVSHVPHDIFSTKHACMLSCLHL